MLNNLATYIDPVWKALVGSVSYDQFSCIEFCYAVDVMNFETVTMKVVVLKLIDSAQESPF